MSEKKSATFRLSQDTLSRLSSLSDSNDCSMADIIENAVSVYSYHIRRDDFILCYGVLTYIDRRFDLSLEDRKKIYDVANLISRLFLAKDEVADKVPCVVVAN